MFEISSVSLFLDAHAVETGPIYNQQCMKFLLGFCH